MDAKRRILVADDDRDLLDLVARALEGEGAEVVKAHSGDELIDRLADGPFTLVVTDISMPWMTGLQAMQSARYIGFKTPLVVMTALKDPEIESQVAALGGDVVLLHKPFELGQLDEAIAKLVHA